MSIGESMANAWHKHPYIIMGVGGVIVVYLLWPSSSSSSSGAATSTDPYADQLAAETALSQSQLAEQAALAQTTAGETVAADSAIASSNEAIAQSNAAAIVSYNQTAQTAIQAEGNLAIAQTQSGSSDFNALIAGLMDFTDQSTAGASNASANGLDAYLTSIGATFSDTIGNDAFSATNSNTLQGLFGQGNTQTGIDTVPFAADVHWAGAPPGGGSGSESYDTTVGAAMTPFTASDNLLGGLWAQAIQAYSTNEASIIKTIPTITPATSPILTGDVQPIPSPVG